MKDAKFCAMCGSKIVQKRARPAMPEIAEIKGEYLRWRKLEKEASGITTVFIFVGIVAFVLSLIFGLFWLIPILIIIGVTLSLIEAYYRSKARELGGKLSYYGIEPASIESETEEIRSDMFGKL